MSITLPPPTLHTIESGEWSTEKGEIIRQEVTEVVFAGPGNSVAPASFRRLCDNLIIHFKRKVRFLLKSHNCLTRGTVMVCSSYVSESLTDLAGLSLATLGSVNNPTLPVSFRGIIIAQKTYFTGFHVFEIHTNFCGDTITKTQIGSRNLG